MGSLISRLTLLAGVVTAALIVGAAPLYRYAGWELMSALGLLKYGTFAAAGTLLLALVWVVMAAINRSGQGLLLVVVAVVLAVGTGQVPIRMKAMADSHPFIHDITTDTANPPVFVALAPVRANVPNGVDYKTDPALQLKGYPDIKTFTSKKSAAELYEKALAVAKTMKWEIVSSSSDEGRIEATDTTAWWAFKDDVVIRVVAEGDGSKLDIRSMSRVGLSDLGKNAERIRAFLAALAEMG
jgi:uncharacterized protein (DUF1499 family)